MRMGISRKLSPGRRNSGSIQGWGNEGEKPPVKRSTHVQRVLGRLRLRAAVEADEAHGLRRKERGQRQGRAGSRGGPPAPGKEGARRGLLSPS